MTGTNLSLSRRIQRRLRAQRWLLDAARRHPRSRQLRAAIERRRNLRIVSSAGSVDAALDTIVRDAVAAASADQAPTEGPP